MTWSLVALVFELRRASVMESGPFVVLALVGGAMLASLTHERRVAKMVGKAGDAVYEHTAVLWRLVLVGLAAASVAAAASPQTGSIYPVAMVVIGIGFAQWGAGARFAWFVWLGVLVVAAGLADVALAPADAARTLRLLVLGLALPAFGLETSRRFLWFRAPAARDDSEARSAR